MLDRPFLSRFSPQRTDPEALEKILVQRHDLLAESVERIRDSVLTDNKHHLLFIGPRGIGKTNLVSLIVHRLKKLPKLQSKMRLAWLNEDETATSFLKLLILIYRDLTQRYPDEFPAADLQRVYGHKPDHARELLGASLLEHLGKRTLVVIMENLDSLFKDMPVEEQRTWRAFVQNHPVFATVGTAQSLFDGVSERTEPFFGFFDTRHLDNLTVDEAITLLRNVAKLNRDDKLEAYLATTTGHARVQAIHDLAGGNPRIYMIFSSFLTVELLDDLVRPFEETADQQLTSYYQERLRWLSAQQREIVQYLCHQRFPVPVKQIAEGMFASHQTIANQLKILRDYRYVRGNERGREVLYELSEPLMRLALQVKETHDRKPLSLIVDFLRVWYDRRDLIERMEREKPGSLGRHYFEAALALIDSGAPNLRHLLLRQGTEALNPLECDDATLARLFALAEETGDAEDFRQVFVVLTAREGLEAKLQGMNRIIAMRTVPPPVLALFLVNRAHLFFLQLRYSDSIADLTRCLGIYPHDDPETSLPLMMRGFVNILSNDPIAALEDWQTLLAKNNDSYLLRTLSELSEGLGYMVVKAIFTSVTSLPSWQEKIATFVYLFSKYEILAQLGEGLVQNIDLIAASHVKHSAYDGWAEAWTAAADSLNPEDRQHLEIPLRLLRTGIAYYKTKDEGVLLSLPSEERKILRQVLKLEPEPAA